MHCSVLVVGDDVDAALKPFDENNELEYVFVDEEDENRKEYETDGVEMIRLNSGELVYPWDNMFKQGDNVLNRTTVIPEGLERVQLPFREKYTTFEEFMSDWHGSRKRDPHHGRYGHYHNPKGQWDWYEVGGRWNGSLKLKPGKKSGQLGQKGWIHPSGALGSSPLPILPGFVDSALKGDVDFEGMNQKIRDGIAADFRRWNSSSEEERTKWWCKKDWPPQPGETVEQFVDRHYQPWCTYAFLGTDGKWQARSIWDGDNFIDTPNWEAVFAELLAAVPDDARITVVDIHS